MIALSATPLLARFRKNYRGKQQKATERRLRAFEKLGRETIPARIVHVPSLLLAEHAENELRKDFTPSERVEIGKAIEDEIGNRRGQRTDLKSEEQGKLLDGELPVNLPEVTDKETREIAAEKAGFGSEKTYRDAKAVTEHAERPKQAQWRAAAEPGCAPNSAWRSPARWQH